MSKEWLADRKALVIHMLSRERERDIERETQWNFQREFFATQTFRSNLSYPSKVKEKSLKFISLTTQNGVPHRQAFPGFENISSHL